MYLTTNKFVAVSNLILPDLIVSVNFYYFPNLENFDFYFLFSLLTTHVRPCPPSSPHVRMRWQLSFFLFSPQLRDFFFSRGGICEEEKRVMEWHVLFIFCGPFLHEWSLMGSESTATRPSLNSNYSGCFYGGHSCTGLTGHLFSICSRMAPDNIHPVSVSFQMALLVILIFIDFINLCL